MFKLASLGQLSAPIAPTSTTSKRGAAATDALVAAYLADHAALLKVSTLTRRLAAVSIAHDARNLPITRAGAKSEWKAMRKRAGVKGFRFHDVRHDFATKLLRKTGNLKLVSRALNHRDISTTMRYAHVMDGELAGALQDLSLSRQISHGKSHAPEVETSQTIDINGK